MNSRRVVRLVPRELPTYKHSRELIVIMRDALEAHRSYYQAGVLHGNINPANIMIVDLDIPSLMGEDEKGILIDLDPCIACRTTHSGKKDAPREDSSKGKAKVPDDE
ncbi:unnamed protein product [Somion occarium]|uniref:Fungal-type protein kinase domain-containing protein n=1 Tax=Somion occarium TaxID=3059160 RepID=A0ABP1EBR7_9APHY